MRSSLCPVIATMEEKLDDITKCLTEMFSVNAATNTKLGMLSSRLEGLEKNVGTQGGVKLVCNLGLSSMNGDIMASRHLDHDYGASNGDEIGKEVLLNYKEMENQSNSHSWQFSLVESQYSVLSSIQMDD